MDQKTIKIVEIVESGVFQLRNFKFFTIYNVGTADVSVDGVPIDIDLRFPQDLAGVRYNEDLNVAFKSKKGGKLLIVGRI